MDFVNNDETHQLIRSSIEKAHSKKRIILFTAFRFTVQMPASNEHAQTAFEMLACLHRAIKEQLFGLTSEHDEIPSRLTMHQEGGM